MIVAVDLDGMLLAFPEFFQFMFKAYQAQGAKVGILTGRPTSEKEYLQESLEKVDIKPDFIVTMPDKMTELVFPTGIYKALVCNALNVDILYDDFQSANNQMIGDFLTYNQRTHPFMGFAYNPEPHPESYSTPKKKE